jgi:hypothetical protein
MYAAYLYIFRAFDSAAATRIAKSPDPEREIADGRWPSAAVAGSGPGPFIGRPPIDGPEALLGRRDWSAQSR